MPSQRRRKNRRFGRIGSSFSRSWRRFFFDLSDRFGLTPVIINPEKSVEFAKFVADIRVEWVLQVTDFLEKRPSEAAKPSLPNGEIEIHTTKSNILTLAYYLYFIL